MSILIKGMDMPENCLISCPFTYFDEYGDEKQKCAFTDIDVLSDEVKNDCPLIEVPEPHGRLVDADFEEQHYASMTTNPTPDVTTQDYLHSAYTARAFQMAKTVIEAEGA